MFRISNGLYGNSIASANELAKGYTLPAIPDAPHFLPASIRAAHDELIAKRKLNMIMLSKAVQDPQVHAGDLIQAYTRLSNQKRGSWSAPQTVLEYLPSSHTVVVAGSDGRRRKYGIEDIRHAVSDNELAIEIQGAIEQFNDDIAIKMSSATERCDYDEDIVDDSYKTVALSDQEDTIDDEYFRDPYSSMTYTPPPPPVSDPESTPASHKRIHGMTTRSQSTVQLSNSTLHAHEIELLPGTELTSNEKMRYRNTLLALSPKSSCCITLKYCLHTQHPMPTSLRNMILSKSVSVFIDPKFLPRQTSFEVTFFTKSNVVTMALLRAKPE